jgi:hypothetical protein
MFPHLLPPRSLRGANNPVPVAGCGASSASLAAEDVSTEVPSSVWNGVGVCSMPRSPAWSSTTFQKYKNSRKLFPATFFADEAVEARIQVAMRLQVLSHWGLHPR